MKPKMSPCCARLAGRLVHEEGALAQLARRAARRRTAGLEVSPTLVTQIEAAKSSVAMVKTMIDEHEAEHAGEAVA